MKKRSIGINRFLRFVFDEITFVCKGGGEEEHNLLCDVSFFLRSFKIKILKQFVVQAPRLQPMQPMLKYGPA